MLRTPVSCAVLLAIVVLALAIPTTTWAAAAPSATTTGIVDLTPSTATFQATINPQGLPTTAHFEYGTTDELLQSTPDVAVGAGTTPVPVNVPVTGLAPGQHYYMAIYASNSAGEEYGLTVEFNVPRLRVPRIVPAGETDITQSSATLHVKVTGYGVPVTLSATTVGPDGVVVPSGPLTITVDGDTALTVTGLQPDTRYRWNATGTSAGGTDTALGTFETLSLIAMPRPVITPRSAEYGTQVMVSGTIAGAPGLAVGLQEQPFPFTTPFTAVAGAAGVTDAGGIYRFTVQALHSAKYGVSAPGYVTPSPRNIAPLRVYASVAAHARRARRHRFVVSGRYWPDVPAKAVLYRLGHGRSGSAISARSSGGNSRTFRFPARKLKPGSYAVGLTMAKSTGIDGTTSASFRVRRR